MFSQFSNRIIKTTYQVPVKAIHSLFTKSFAYQFINLRMSYGQYPCESVFFYHLLFVRSFIFALYFKLNNSIKSALLDTANSTFSPSVFLAVVFDTTTDSSQTCAVLGGLVRAVPVRFSTHFYYFF